MHNNYKLTEFIPDELVLPTTCLYQRDNKDSYTVQTATSSQLYFNYFIYKSTPEQVLEKLLTETKEVCKETEEYLKERFQHYLLIISLSSRDISWEIAVTSYEDYIEELQQQGINTDAIIEDTLKQSNNNDLHAVCFEIIAALQEIDPEKKRELFFFLHHRFYHITI